MLSTSGSVKMKKFAFILILILLIISCRNEENVVFSCDPSIDKYVHLKSAQLQKLSLDEFLSMNLEMQRATYRSYLADKKYSLWREKMERILGCGEWNSKELNHIASLKEFIYPEYFEIQSGNYSPKYQQSFEWNWIQYAKDTLEWGNRQLAFVVSSLYVDYDDFTAVFQSNPGTDNPVGSCQCNLTEDFCNYQLGFKCKNNGCPISESGCGWLWLSSCNGQCQRIEE